MHAGLGDLVQAGLSAAGHLFVLGYDLDQINNNRRNNKGLRSESAA
jgi:hypothetical protein